MNISRIRSIAGKYASPFAGQTEQDRPLPFGHSGAPQALRRELRVRVTGAEHQVSHIIVDPGSFQLVGRKRGHQIERLVILAAQTPDGFPVLQKLRWQDASMERSANGLVTHKCNVQPQVMTAKLKHPWRDATGWPKSAKV
jgi:hypothetical protein